MSDDSPPRPRWEDRDYRQNLIVKKVSSWAATIAQHRDQIEALLEENPSLRRSLDEVAWSAYSRAVRLATIETGLPRDAFPPELPYGAKEILGADPERGRTDARPCEDCA